MRVKDLRVGLEVAVNKGTGWDRKTIAVRGIVLDGEYWSSSWGHRTANEGIPRRGRETVVAGYWSGVNSGIPIAIEGTDGFWVTDLIIPAKIIGPWAEWAERVAAEDAAAAEKRALELAAGEEERVRLDKAVEALNELLGTNAHRSGPNVVLGLNSIEAIVTALGLKAAA